MEWKLGQVFTVTSAPRNTGKGNLGIIKETYLRWILWLRMNKTFIFWLTLEIFCSYVLRSVISESYSTNIGVWGSESARGTSSENSRRFRSLWITFMLKIFDITFSHFFTSNLLSKTSIRKYGYHKKIRFLNKGRSAFNGSHLFAQRIHSFLSKPIIAHGNKVQFSTW